jgi:hypothetical protein
MPAKSGQYLRQYQIFSTGATVTVGSEPASYLAVNLAGAPSVNARGVTNVSREGYVNIMLLGQTPCKVANGVTIAKGGLVSSNANGELIPATHETDILGIALDAVTVAANDYIEILVNPQPARPAAPEAPETP